MKRSLLLVIGAIGSYLRIPEAVEQHIQDGSMQHSAMETHVLLTLWLLLCGTMCHVRHLFQPLRELPAPPRQFRKVKYSGILTGEPFSQRSNGRPYFNTIVSLGCSRICTTLHKVQLQACVLYYLSTPRSTVLLRGGKLWSPKEECEQCEQSINMRLQKDSRDASTQSLRIRPITRRPWLQKIHQKLKQTTS